MLLKGKCNLARSAEQTERFPGSLSPGINADACTSQALRLVIFVGIPNLNKCDLGTSLGGGAVPKTLAQAGQFYPCALRRALQDALLLGNGAALGRTGQARGFYRCHLPGMFPRLGCRRGGRQEQSCLARRTKPPSFPQLLCSC